MFSHLSPPMRAQSRARLPTPQRGMRRSREPGPVFQSPQIALEKRSVARRLHPLDPNKPTLFFRNRPCQGRGWRRVSSPEAKDVLALPTVRNFSRKCRMDLGMDIALFPRLQVHLSPHSSQYPFYSSITPESVSNGNRLMLAVRPLWGVSESELLLPSSTLIIIF
jgi:hypothetical protein